MVIAFHLRVGYVIYSCILPFLRIAGLPFTPQRKFQGRPHPFLEVCDAVL